MTSTYRVLYVDDEPATCRAFARALRKEGYFVTSMSEPKAAITSLQEKQYDILVSDYRMPAMNGVELLEHARDIMPDTKRILISGYLDPVVVADGINRSTVDGVIFKPWSNTELVLALQRMVKISRLENSSEFLNDQLWIEKCKLNVLNKKLDRIVTHRTTALLDSLICALDLRDTETQWHSRRVSAYAKYLGHSIGIRGKELTDIEHGALLHDIGKIGISDSILLKPGKLNELEWAEMKRHPVLGYEIVKHIDFLASASLIVLQHQERWDGKGYPAGLRAQEICIGARIFHIVDTFDAITSDRPYRGAQPYEAARSEIIRCVNTQFDPFLVDAWCRIDSQVWENIKMALQ